VKRIVDVQLQCPCYDEESPTRLSEEGPKTLLSSFVGSIAKSSRMIPTVR
jgi:hypothetical protein